MEKLIIYQIFTRLFGNATITNIPHGSITENGCGKFNAFTPKVLKEIKQLGITHVWYTGILEHATQTNYTHAGIETDPSSMVKGKAGSPYAIKDYYDVDPDLAEDIANRMQEFEALVARTHKAELKVPSFGASFITCAYNKRTFLLTNRVLLIISNFSWFI